MAVTGLVHVLCGVKKDYNLLEPFYVCLAGKIHKPLGVVG
jgi:hypothetical protein